MEEYNDYWELGFMTMSDEWNATWDEGSEFYADTDCDSWDSWDL